MRSWSSCVRREGVTGLFGFCVADDLHWFSALNSATLNEALASFLDSPSRNTWTDSFAQRLSLSAEQRKRLIDEVTRPAQPGERPRARMGSRRAANLRRGNRNPSFGLPHSPETPARRGDLPWTERATSVRVCCRDHGRLRQRASRRARTGVRQCSETTLNAEVRDRPATSLCTEAVGPVRMTYLMPAPEFRLFAST